MKNKLPISLVVVALVLLSCRAVPGGLLSKPSATPEPSPAATSTQAPAATETPLPAAPSLPTDEPTAAAPTLTPTLEPTLGLPPLPFVDQQSEVQDAEKQYTIKLRYPGLDSGESYATEFNQMVQREVDGAVEQFKLSAADASQFPADGTGSFLEIDYELFYNQGGLASLQLKAMVYIKGAAHPNTFSIPLNFDFRAGSELALADLFIADSQHLAVLAALCMADLQNRDLPLFLEGAAPKAENYRSWNITPQGLRITFDPYQVAPYAAGPQVVNLDWALLGVILRPDLGLPVP